MKVNLFETVNKDCQRWNMLNNRGMVASYIYVEDLPDSEETRLYRLCMNGNELWYGTLKEINAIVKTMIVRLEKNDFLE